MSGSVGSLARQTASTYGSIGPISGAYSPSKTFLNAVTVQYAKELGPNSLINLACPGYMRPTSTASAAFAAPSKAPRS